MTPKYVIWDEYDNAGQNISLSQGEKRKIFLMFFQDSGMPRALDNAYDEIVVKVYTGVSSSPIQKKLSLSSVTEIKDTNLGLIGVSFTLTAVDTALITAATAGIPVKLIFSSTGTVTDEYNLPNPILVDAPTIA